jgi:hypothetical protein
MYDPCPFELDPKPADEARGEIGVERSGVSGGVENDDCAETDDNEGAVDRWGSELSDASGDDEAEDDEAGESTSSSMSSGSNAATPPVIESERLFRV